MKKLRIAGILASTLVIGCSTIEDNTNGDYKFSLDEVRQRVEPVKQTALKCRDYVDQKNIEQATLCLEELRAVSGKGSAYQEVASEFYQRAIDDGSVYEDSKYIAILQDMDDVMAGGLYVLNYVDGNKAAPADTESSE